MRVCLIGDFSGKLEEGMQLVAFHLTEELSKCHKVLSSDPRDIFSRSFWREIKLFNPQIIHYLSGPSIISFIIMKKLSALCEKNTKKVMSAIHPNLPSFSKGFLPLLKPDLILTLSYETEKMFTNLGCRTEFLPLGVDTEKFLPISAETKGELRKKYRIDKRDLVVLHVGSLAKRRNVGILSGLQGEKDYQVIIISHPSVSAEKAVYRRLKEKGCLIWREYFKGIEEIYALSDCYIFPTKDKLGSIELPLSVMEAMSCNLPVVTTKFGALQRVFKEGNGLFFAEGEEEILDAIEKIKDGMQVKTRDTVLPYSWEIVAKRLEEIYEHLCGPQIDNFKHGGVLI